MKQCIELIETIFKRERKFGRPNSRFILFIASDGDSMDGDPRPAAVRLRKQGVEVISCFVSSTDVVQGKHIYAARRTDWPTGAQVMFDIASHVSTESPEFKYLEKAGWKANCDPVATGVLPFVKRLFRPDPKRLVKLFAQINHSSLLDEFLRVVLAPLYAEARRNDPHTDI